MGLYSFQPRFVPFIRSGAKTHTIRATRKYLDKPGNTIHCFTGLRTKKAKLVGRFRCVKVEEIRIMDGAFGDEHHASIVIDGVLLDRSEREALARKDGFKDLEEMIQFWRATHKLPFSGNIIHWQFSKREVERRKAKGWKYLKRDIGLEPERRGNKRRRP